MKTVGHTARTQSRRSARHFSRGGSGAAQLVRLLLLSVAKDGAYGGHNPLDILLVTGLQEKSLVLLFPLLYARTIITLVGHECAVMHRRRPLVVGVADTLDERPQFAVRLLRQRIVVGQLRSQPIVPRPNVRVGGQVELDGHLEQCHAGQYRYVGNRQVFAGHVRSVHQEYLQQCQRLVDGAQLFVARGAQLGRKLLLCVVDTKGENVVVVVVVVRKFETNDAQLTVYSK